MTRTLTSFVPSLAVVTGMALVSATAADKTPHAGQITGTVRMIEKDQSSIVVMKGNAPRQVIYDSNTKWMQGTQASNTPASLDQLKEGWYINCKGRFEGVKLIASACRFRESK